MTWHSHATLRGTERDGGGDEAKLERLAEMWKSKLDWVFEVADRAFHEPRGVTALVFGVTPDKALAFGKGQPYSQTRYRFTG